MRERRVFQRACPAGAFAMDRIQIWTDLIARVIIETNSQAHFGARLMPVIFKTIQHVTQPQWRIESVFAGAECKNDVNWEGTEVDGVMANEGNCLSVHRH